MLLLKQSSAAILGNTKTPVLHTCRSTYRVVPFPLTRTQSFQSLTMANLHKLPTSSSAKLNTASAVPCVFQVHLCIPGASVHWYDKPETPRVSIIMGSDTDLPVMKEAAKILDLFGVTHEVKIVSAHRTPEMMYTYATSAHSRGVQVIIAGAGGAAHLPGMVASLTPLPVIGVPVQATPLDGVDSLLSIVQMPRGVPVATVAINNATNAALLAVRMLGISDTDLVSRMRQYQEDMRDENLNKGEKLETQGWESYLNQ
ncbi:hypothetical protein AXX17_AT2G04280 [Arabidopsis thaliana]|uniref:phosphoribosylaminoimidazole carboxylase n=1 Tax=Arabidopsis thaliana TaxID=3702 RepID=A0A178VLD9_ARATH|nr:hypothetical protein AXX17_AT2G04280 [Arabidopsis thaliana]